MSLRITSSAFPSGAPIPQDYTGDGADRSPPLSWSGIPDGTKELALICDDPDAPTPEPWVHWIIYGIPAECRELSEGVPPQKPLEADKYLKQGSNSWPASRTVGYRGPAPPRGHGTHHYYFRLYALDQKLNAASGLDKQGLLALMKGHVLATAELIGTYKR